MEGWRMRVLVAPQEFKGSLTAAEAARAIAAGVREAMPSADVIVAPMSDGGPGLVEVMLSRGATRVEADCSDPLMRPIRGAFALLEDGSAVIEMAAASGLVLLTAAERSPLAATTFGTGELILAALDRGRRSIVIGVGGSATVDAGAGALQALGVRLLDAEGWDLPLGGGALVRLDRIDLSGVDARLATTPIRVAVDVRNTLCGETGAAAMFGPQKGASAADVALLEEGLRRFAEVARRDCGVDVEALVGGGAAGGLSAGLVAGVGATIEPGFDLVAEVIGLEALSAAADIVITGEGRLDAQTAFGKTAAGVAGMARRQGKPVGVLAGSVVGDAGRGVFDEVEVVTPAGMSLEEGMRDAEALLRAGALRIVGRLVGRC
jgi:glycerate kinase